MAKKTYHKGKGDKRAQNARRRERQLRQPKKQDELHRLIDGNLTYYPAAYCKRKQGYLSVGLLDIHECYKKGCKSVVGLENGQ